MYLNRISLNKSKLISNIIQQSVSYSTTTTTTVEPEVKFEEKGKCVNITLNRPKALNALNVTMVKELTPKYQEWKQFRDGDLVIVMKGAGEKAFCAGGDIRAIYEYGKPNSTIRNQPDAQDLSDTFFRDEYTLNYLIGTSPIPQVSIYNGITMGGGVGLSVHGAFRVATENTMFAMPETGIGFFCDVGGSHFLPRLPNHIGMYLGLTGNKIKGKIVRDLGIATHYVPLEKISELQKAIESLSNPTHSKVKEILDTFSEKSNSNILVDEQNPENIEKIFSKSSVQEIYGELEKVNNEWSKKTISTLNQMSPLSLAVVHEQLTRGKSLDLKECLKMEFRMAQAYMKGNDFFEGVRALLVDKDKNPKWVPSTLSQVTRDQVESYFKPVPAELKL
eukprot:gene9959-12211_t